MGDNIITRKKVNHISSSLTTTAMTEAEIKKLYENLRKNTSVDNKSILLSEKIDIELSESISRQEEQELGKGGKNDDTLELVVYRINKALDEARDKFTKEEREYLSASLMVLIRTCAKECAPAPGRQYTIEDVYEACYIGFTKALNKYNKKTSVVSFSCYAYSAMRRSVADLARSYNHKCRQVEVMSLEEYMVNSNKDGGTGKAALVEEDKRNNPETQIVLCGTKRKNMQKDFIFKEFVRALETTLTEEEQYIFRHTFLDGAERISRLELAETLHISVERARQKTNSLQKKLKKTAIKLGYNYSDFF